MAIDISNNNKIKAGDLFIIEDEYNNDPDLNFLDDVSQIIKPETPKVVTQVNDFNQIPETL